MTGNNNCCCSSTIHLLLPDDLIVCEILSRLPAKSLMKFKCVCKSWQLLIEKDRRFIDLHFTRSKSRSTLYILPRTPEYETRRDRESWFLLAELSLPSAVELVRGRATFQRQIPLSERDPSTHMLKSVNGLVCFANLKHGVRIYNPSTRESTPWIKSLIKQQHGHEMPEYITFNEWSYFGYNPATKEHKVLSMWYVRKQDKYGNGIGDDETVCEVLTVGGGKQQNSFRMVDDVLLAPPYYLGDSVYVNGSIYWYRAKPNRDESRTDYDRDELSIIEFNCGTEKFREISVPNSITDICRFRSTLLMEVDGCLALLAMKHNRTSMKMSLLHDNKDNQSSKPRWVEEELLLPPFEWTLNRLDSILPIPGTDFFLVRSATIDDDFSFYYYNWKKKKYSSTKVEIDGISCVFFLGQFDFYTLTETLLPVN
ncbi:hypothetical protein MKW92_032797 [Papaver armeniacum]|nr:hypothetical protein MKW92_032797 [Papaver armeniacum]